MTINPSLALYCAISAFALILLAIIVKLIKISSKQQKTDETFREEKVLSEQKSRRIAELEKKASMSEKTIYEENKKTLNLLRSELNNLEEKHEKDKNQLHQNFSKIIENLAQAGNLMRSVTSEARKAVRTQLTSALDMAGAWMSEVASGANKAVQNVSAVKDQAISGAKSAAEKQVTSALEIAGNLTSEARNAVKKVVALKDQAISGAKAAAETQLKSAIDMAGALMSEVTSGANKAAEKQLTSALEIAGDLMKGVIESVQNVGALKDQATPVAKENKVKQREHKPKAPQESKYDISATRSKEDPLSPKDIKSSVTKKLKFGSPDNESKESSQKEPVDLFGTKDHEATTRRLNTPEKISELFGPDYHENKFFSNATKRRLNTPEELGPDDINPLSPNQEVPPTTESSSSTTSFVNKPKVPDSSKKRNSSKYDTSSQRKKKKSLSTRVKNAAQEVVKALTPNKITSTPKVAPASNNSSLQLTARTPQNDVPASNSSSLTTPILQEAVERYNAVVLADYSPEGSGYNSEESKHSTQ